MKNVILVIGAALGIAWFVNKKKAQSAVAADPWAEASDPV